MKRKALNRLITSGTHKLFRTLPDPILTARLANIINFSLQGQSIENELLDLENKIVLIHITDTNTRLCWRIQRQRLSPWRDNKKVNVSISGSLHDFWLLAIRQEDPDTLFFHRRLKLEGETETGLYLKNILDSLDFEPQLHFQAVLGERRGDWLYTRLQRSGIERKLQRLYTQWVQSEPFQQNLW